MNATLRRFWRDEEGTETVEWAVVTILLLTASVVVLVMIKGELLDIFRSAFAALAEDPPDTYIP